VLSALALRLRSKARPEPILVFGQRAIQDLHSIVEREWLPGTQWRI